MLVASFSSHLLAHSFSFWWPAVDRFMLIPFCTVTAISPSLPLFFCTPAGAYEQGLEDPTWPLRDDRWHILATICRDATPLRDCSETPRKQLQDPPGNFFLMQWCFRQLRLHLYSGIFNSVCLYSAVIMYICVRWWRWLTALGKQCCQWCSIKGAL